MLDTHSSGDREIPAVKTPARLVLATNAGNELEPIMDLLVEAGLAREGQSSRNGLPSLADALEPGDLKTIPDWLAGDADAHLLLLFNAPVPLIAQSMEDGLPPDQALDRWLADAQAILKIVRRHRRRLSLLSLEGVLANPAEFTDILGQRLGIDLPSAGKQVGHATTPGALFRMMAENAVRESGEARNAAAELEANALPTPSTPAIELPKVEAVYREFSQAINRTRNQELEEENELLLQQLHQIQDELESFVLRNNDLQKSLEKEKSATQRLRTQNDEGTVKVEARLRELQTENERLQQQSRQVKEEIEAYYLSDKDAQRQLQEMRERLKEADLTIQALYNSKSWKITKPLRFVLGLFSGDRNVDR